MSAVNGVFSGKSKYLAAREFVTFFVALLIGVSVLVFSNGEYSVFRAFGIFDNLTSDWLLYFDYITTPLVFAGGPSLVHQILATLQE